MTTIASTVADNRRRTTNRSVAALIALGLSLILATAPTPAAAQSSTGALVDRLQDVMTRPMTPPEAWGATAAARSLVPEVREARARWAAAVAEALAVPETVVAGLLPPLGRGPQSAVPADSRPTVERLLGRTLTAAERDAVARADAARDAALAPHRARLAETLAALTDLPPARIVPLLPEIGL